MAKSRKPDQDEPRGKLATPEQRISKVRNMLDYNQKEIEKALASLMDPVQFLRACMTHYQRGGKAMMEADPRSFVAACFEAAQLQMKPDSVLGDCYLIPRRDNEAGCVLVNFQLGYRGALKLVRRSRMVADMAPEVAFENDKFEVFYGTDRRIVHRPWWNIGQKESGRMIASYNVATLSDGKISFSPIVTEEDLEQAKRLSGNPFKKEPSNVWIKHPKPMARKKAIHVHSKYLPIQDDAMEALVRDDMREQGIMDDDFRDLIEKMKDRGQTVTSVPRGQPTSLDDLLDDDDTIVIDANEPPPPEDPPPE